MLDQTIVHTIYNSIFKKLKRKEIDLFLCGGASTAKRTSYRDKLRNSLKSAKNLAIYYPEDLFSEILARKKTNLLTLERILAENSDAIIIVCESPGSFTELGAFVSSSDTCSKVVPFIQSKYKNDKSFINQGPVEYLKTHSDRNTKVVYFSQDFNSVENQAKTVLRESAAGLGKEGSKYRLLQISGQVCFMLLLLYFFDAVEFGELRETVRSMYEIERELESDRTNDEGIINSTTARSGWMQEFETIFAAARKRLYKKGCLSKRKDLGQYHLTTDGYFRVRELLKNMGIKPLENNSEITGNKHNHAVRDTGNTRDRYSYVDKIRLDVLKKSYYRCS